MEIGQIFVLQHLELEFALSKDCSYQQYCVMGFDAELRACNLILRMVDALHPSVFGSTLAFALVLLLLFSLPFPLIHSSQRSKSDGYRTYLSAKPTRACQWLPGARLKPFQAEEALASPTLFLFFGHTVVD